MVTLVNGTLSRALMVSAFALWGASSAQAATLAVDLSDATTPVNSGTISDGSHTLTFDFDKIQPSGTGVLDSFLRIQTNGTEQGYNTTVANAGQLPFEEKFGSFTHDLLFSALEVSGGEYLFVLDIGEPATGTESLLSLDGLKLFSTTTAGQNSSSTDGNGDADGITGTLLWNMDALLDNYILLDANRDGQPGNGVSDMLMRVPAAVFAGVNPTDNIILWSRFGLQNGATSGSRSFGTFEEWAHITGLGDNGGNGGGPPQQIPEPGILALFGTGLLGLSLASRRRRQPQQ